MYKTDLVKKNLLLVFHELYILYSIKYEGGFEVSFLPYFMTGFIILNHKILHKLFSGYTVFK